MFTGLVEAKGTIYAIEFDTDEFGTKDARIAIEVPFAAELVRGESVAINGVCLTVTDFNDQIMWADAMPETLRVTTLGQLTPGDKVNLERALPAGGRLGGHIVSGHVDAVGRIISRSPGERWDEVRIELPRQIAALVALKGSITVSGVSLTVSAIGDDFFEVSLIPETLNVTTLGELSVGESVNLEVDVIARYLQRINQMSAAPVETPEAAEPSPESETSKILAAQETEKQ